MVIKFKNYQIKSYEHGYISQRMIGKQQKLIGYYENIENAVKDTFHYRVLVETTNNIIDATNKATLQLESAKLLKKIKCIENEIMEAIKNEQR